ncbi:Nucleic acid-binding OB-fold-like protein [Euphorbia peplus]|nr:Nucleic acid-binding OB-fold-like protein [Euphorbia peplus]
MDRSLYNTHVKLLSSDLLTLTQTPSHSSSDPISFSRHDKTLSRVEILGTVVSRDHKPGKLLKFIIDDSTACVTCVLWLNQRTSPYFFRRNPQDVRLIADTADHFASLVHIGNVARVRGRITSYRGIVQITVSDVVVERDPNVEILHLLQCIKLARNRYDFASPCE